MFKRGIIQKTGSKSNLPREEKAYLPVWCSNESMASCNCLIQLSTNTEINCSKKTKLIESEEAAKSLTLTLVYEINNCNILVYFTSE